MSRLIVAADRSCSDTSTLTQTSGTLVSVGNSKGLQILKVINEQQCEVCRSPELWRRPSRVLMLDPWCHGNCTKGYHQIHPNTQQAFSTKVNLEPGLIHRIAASLRHSIRLRFPSNARTSTTRERTRTHSLSPLFVSGGHDVLIGHMCLDSGPGQPSALVHFQSCGVTNRSVASHGIQFWWTLTDHICSASTLVCYRAFNQFFLLDQQSATDPFTDLQRLNNHGLTRSWSS